jgi:hypothetical protein
MKKTVFAMLGLALLAQSAQANTACLQIGRIWGWKALDARTLIVEDELHRKFRLGLMGYCPRLPLKLALGFKSLGAISGLDCIRKGDEVISQDAGGGYTCPVMSVTPYTPATEKSDKAAVAARGQRSGY